MPKRKGAPVTGVEGNVVFCDFRMQLAPEDTEAGAGVHELFAGIRDAAAEINSVATETLATHAASPVEHDVTRLLLQAVSSIDNIAFQSNIFAAGGGLRGDRDAAFIAASVYRFAAAAARLNRQLRALVTERTGRSAWEECALQDIVRQAAQLESAIGASMPAQGENQTVEMPC